MSPQRFLGLTEPRRVPIRREGVLQRVMFDSLVYYIGSVDARRADLGSDVRDIIAGQIHLATYLRELAGQFNRQTYFVALEVPGRRWRRPVKIGQSISLETRLQSIQTTCPFPICLLASAPSIVFSEPILHAEFRREHLRGEWFCYSKKLDRFLGELIALQATQAALDSSIDNKLATADTDV